MSSTKDPYISICEEFSTSFKQDIIDLKVVDESLKHHAKALENCLKLLQTASESVHVQNLWNGLIRSAINTLLNLKHPISKQCLGEFASMVKPWLIDEQFKGLNHADLLDMYNLAVDGPWSKSPLKELMDGTITDAKKLAESFEHDPDCAHFRLRALLVSKKFKQLAIFGTAMLIHPKMKGNTEFENIFQHFANMSLASGEIQKLLTHFNLKITITVIDELLEENESAEKLCTATMEYLWKNEDMNHIEEVTSKWCHVMHTEHGAEKFFHLISERLKKQNCIIQSVQQCIILATALWKEIPDLSRYSCVEILHHALCLLAPDSNNQAQIKTGILSSIIYFVPNSQVARYCVLTIFVREPTVEHYFEVAKAYKSKFDRSKESIEKGDIRMRLLDHLQHQWPSEFLLSNNWDWMRLRKLCHETMTRDDAAYVQLVETEEAQKSLADEIAVEASQNSVIPNKTVQDTSMNSTDTSVTEDSEHTTTSDSCDCLVCNLKQSNGEKTPYKHIGACHLRNSTTAQRKPESIPPSTLPSSGDKSVSWTCPEETCLRAFRSKTGISRHLNAIHSWSSAEIGVFFDSFDKNVQSQKTRPSRSDFLGKTTVLSEDNMISVNHSSEKAEESTEVDIIETPAGSSTPLEGSSHPSTIENGIVASSMTTNSDSTNLMKNKIFTETPTLSLPPIFAANSVPSKSVAAKTVKGIPKEKATIQNQMDIECPIESCTRTFRHRHTVQAHIEFRHKIDSKKAITLAKNAKFVPAPPSSLLRNKNSSENTKSSDADIVKSRGWYWMVDEFLFLDAEQTLPGFQTLYRRQDTLKSSIARDVICLLGSAPDSCDLTTTQNNIRDNWKVDLPLHENLVSQEEQVKEVLEDEESSFMETDTFQFDHHEPDIEPEPPLVTRKLTDIKSLLKMEVQLKSPQKQQPQESLLASSASLNDIVQAKIATESASRDMASQTFFLPCEGNFGDRDHFHVLRKKQQKVKPPKSKALSLAFTIKTGGVYGIPTRTISTQCCDEKGEPVIKVNPTVSGRKYAYANTPPAAKKGSLQQKKAPVAAKPMSVEGGSGKPKVKRKYDIQTIYQMAEKYKDMEADPNVSGDTSNSSKSSFEDALNYSTSAVLLAERVKQKSRRKSSSSKTEAKPSDIMTKGQPSDQKSADPGVSSQTKSKKVKKVKPSVTKDLPPKRNLPPQSDVSENVKRRRQEIADTAKQTSANYQELLKQAEELNTKKKMQKETAGKTVVAKIHAEKVNEVKIEKDVALPTVKAPALVKDEDLGASKVTQQERHVLKSATKKRRISLRKLSSILKLDDEAETKLNVDESGKLDDSVSMQSEDSLYSHISHNRSTSSSEATLDSSDCRQNTIVCPKCNKRMKSAFALACHMRKRHKGHSKKVFFPGSEDVITTKTKRSKNEIEPPVISEASDRVTSVADQVAHSSENASQCSNEEFFADTEVSSDSDNGFSMQQDNSVSAENQSTHKWPGLCSPLNDRNWTDSLMKVMPDHSTPICSNSSECESFCENLTQPELSQHSTPVGPVSSDSSSDENPSENMEVLWIQNDRREYCCMVPSCDCSYIIKTSLWSHFKRKHPELIPMRFYDLSDKQRRKYVAMASGHTVRKLSKSDSASNTSVTSMTTPKSKGVKLSKLKTERRTAYKHAAVQIHLGSASPAAQKWGMARELSILYNKQANRRIAMALKPAPKLKKLERSASFSSESTESFEADYNAKFACWNCKELFHTRSNLTKHIQMHLKLLSLIPYRCHFNSCLYAFETVEELVAHKKLHLKRGCHICLFCPNNSRGFRSVRRLLIHEHLEHTDLKVNMETLRRQFCLQPYKPQCIKKFLPALSEANRDADHSDIEQEENFLAEGHRRSTGRGMISECLQQNQCSSVAVPRCGDADVDAEIRDVLTDVVQAVHDYRRKLVRKQTRMRKRKAKSSAKLSSSAEAKRGENMEKFGLEASGIDGKKLNLSPTVSISDIRLSPVGSQEHTLLRRFSERNVKADKPKYKTSSSEATKKLSLTNFDIPDEQESGNEVEMNASCSKSEVSCNTLNESLQNESVVVATASCLPGNLGSDSSMSRLENMAIFSKLDNGTSHNHDVESQLNVVASTSKDLHEISSGDSMMTEKFAEQSALSSDDSIYDISQEKDNDVNKSPILSKIILVKDNNKFDDVSEHGKLNTYVVGLPKVTTSTQKAFGELSEIDSSMHEVTSPTLHELKMSSARTEIRTNAFKSGITSKVTSLVEYSDISDESSLASNPSETNEVITPSDFPIASSPIQMSEESSSKLVEPPTTLAKPDMNRFLDSDDQTKELPPVFPQHSKKLDASVERNNNPKEFVEPEKQVSQESDEKSSELPPAISQLKSGLDVSLGCKDMKEAPPPLQQTGSQSMNTDNAELSNSPSKPGTQGPERTFVESKNRPSISTPTPAVFASPSGSRATEASSRVAQTVAGLNTFSDILSEIGEVVHKLVCDVEIEEQAQFLRLCGMVPTDIMYLSNADECTGSNVSVHGYKAEAFMWLELAEQVVSYYDQSLLQNPSGTTNTEVVDHPAPVDTPPGPNCGVDNKVDGRTTGSSPEKMVEDTQSQRAFPVLQDHSNTNALPSEPYSGTSKMEDGFANAPLLNKLLDDNTTTPVIRTDLENHSLELKDSPPKPCIGVNQPVFGLRDGLSQNHQEDHVIQSYSAANIDILDNTVTHPLSSPHKPCTETVKLVDSLQATGTDHNMEVLVNGMEQTTAVLIMPENQGTVMPGGEQECEISTPAIHLQGNTNYKHDSPRSQSNKEETTLQQSELLPNHFQEPERQIEHNQKPIEHTQVPERQVEHTQELKRQIEHVQKPEQQTEHIQNPTEHNQEPERQVEHMEGLERQTEHNQLPSFGEGFASARDMSLLSSHMQSMSVARNHPLWTLDANLTFSELVKHDLSTFPQLQQLVYCRYNVVVNPDLGFSVAPLSGVLISYPAQSDEARSLAYSMIRSTKSSRQDPPEPSITCDESIPKPSDHLNETENDTDAAKAGSVLDASITTSGESEETDSCGETDPDTSLQSSCGATNPCESDHDTSVSVDSKKLETDATSSQDVGKEGEDAKVDGRGAEENRRVGGDFEGKENEETVTTSLISGFMEDFKAELKSNKTWRRTVVQDLPSMFHKRGRPKARLNRFGSYSTKRKRRSMAEIVALCDNLPALQEQLENEETEKDRKVPKIRVHKKKSAKVEKMSSDVENLGFASESSRPMVDWEIADTVKTGRKRPRKQVLTKKNFKKPDLLVFKSKVKTPSDHPLIPVKKRIGRPPKVNGKTAKKKATAQAKIKPVETEIKRPVEKKIKKKTTKEKTLKLVPVLDRLKIPESRPTSTVTDVSSCVLMDHSYLKTNSSPPNTTKPKAKKVKRSNFSPIAPRSTASTTPSISSTTTSATSTPVSSHKTKPIQTSIFLSAVTTNSSQADVKKFSATTIAIPVPTAAVPPLKSLASLIPSTLPSAVDEFPCSMCSKTIKGTTRYITHLSVHHIFCKKKHVCKRAHCFRSFETPEELQVHGVLHETKGFPCLFCREWSPTLKDINAHIDTKHINLHAAWNSTLADITRRCGKRKQEYLASSSHTLQSNIAQTSVPSTSGTHKLNPDKFLQIKKSPSTPSQQHASKSHDVHSTQLHMRVKTVQQITVKSSKPLASTGNQMPILTSFAGGTKTTSTSGVINSNKPQMPKLSIKQISCTDAAVQHSRNVSSCSKQVQTTNGNPKAMLVMRTTVSKDVMLNNKKSSPKNVETFERKRLALVSRKTQMEKLFAEAQTCFRPKTDHLVSVASRKTATEGAAQFSGCIVNRASPVQAVKLPISTVHGTQVPTVPAPVHLNPNFHPPKVKTVSPVQAVPRNFNRTTMTQQNVKQSKKMKSLAVVTPIVRNVPNSQANVMMIQAAAAVHAQNTNISRLNQQPALQNQVNVVGNLANAAVASQPQQLTFNLPDQDNNIRFPSQVSAHDPTPLRVLQPAHSTVAQAGVEISPDNRSSSNQQGTSVHTNQQQQFVKRTVPMQPNAAQYQNMQGAERFGNTVTPHRSLTPGQQHYTVVQSPVTYRSKGQPANLYLNSTNQQIWWSNNNYSANDNQTFRHLVHNAGTSSAPAAGESADRAKATAVQHEQPVNLVESGIGGQYTKTVSVPFNHEQIAQQLRGRDDVSQKLNEQLKQQLEASAQAAQHHDQLETPPKQFSSHTFLNCDIPGFERPRPFVVATTTVCGDQSGVGKSRGPPSQLGNTAKVRPTCAVGVVRGKSVTGGKRQLPSQAPAQAKRRKSDSSVRKQFANLPTHDRNGGQLFLDLDKLGESRIDILECEYCSNMYSKLTDLQNHMKSDHYLHLCPVPRCGNVFGSEDFLANHMREKHGQLSQSQENAEFSHTEKVVSESSGTQDPGRMSEGGSDGNDKASTNREIAAKVWDSNMSRSVIEDNRKQFEYFLNHNSVGVPESEILWCLFYEVKTYAERSGVRLTEQGLQCKRCPIARCPVLGGKKALYYHILEQHSLEKIYGFLQKRIQSNKKRRAFVSVVNPEPIVIEDDDETPPPASSQHPDISSTRDPGIKLEKKKDENPGSSELQDNESPASSSREATLEENQLASFEVSLPEDESSAEVQCPRCDESSSYVDAGADDLAESMSGCEEVGRIGEVELILDSPVEKVESSYTCLVNGCKTILNSKPDVANHMRAHNDVSRFHIEGAQVWPLYECSVALVQEQSHAS